MNIGFGGAACCFPLSFWRCSAESHFAYYKKRRRKTQRGGIYLGRIRIEKLLLLTKHGLTNKLEPAPQRAWAQQQKASALSSRLSGAAACLAEPGEIFRCNVEKKCLGMSVCAKRSAFFTGVISSVRNFRAIAVVAKAMGLHTGRGLSTVSAEFYAAPPVYAGRGDHIARLDYLRVFQLQHHLSAAGD